MTTTTKKSYQTIHVELFLTHHEDPSFVHINILYPYLLAIRFPYYTCDIIQFTSLLLRSILIFLIFLYFICNAFLISFSTAVNIPVFSVIQELLVFEVFNPYNFCVFWPLVFFKKSGTHDISKLKVGIGESNFPCNWLMHGLTFCDSRS